MKKAFFTPAILSLLFLASSASAIEYNFLKSSPAFYFSEQDWKLYMNAAGDTLDHHKDNSQLNWSNPVTGSSGYFIPMNTTKKNGLLCRDLKIYTYAQDRKDISNFQVCKYNDGWKVPGDNFKKTKRSLSQHHEQSQLK